MPKQKPAIRTVIYRAFPLYDQLIEVVLRAEVRIKPNAFKLLRLTLDHIKYLVCSQKYHENHINKFDTLVRSVLDGDAARLFNFMQAFDDSSAAGRLFVPADRDKNLSDRIEQVEAFLKPCDRADDNIEIIWQARDDLKTIRTENGAVEVSTNEWVVRGYFGDAFFVDDKGRTIKLSSRMLDLFFEAEHSEVGSGIAAVKQDWRQGLYRDSDPLPARTEGVSNDVVLEKFKRRSDIQIFKGAGLKCLLTLVDFGIVSRAELADVVLHKFLDAASHPLFVYKSFLAERSVRARWPMVLVAMADPDDFVRFIELVPQETLNKAVICRNESCIGSLLQLAAAYQPGANFIRFIDKLDSVVLNTLVCEDGEPIVYEKEISDWWVTRERIKVFAGVVSWQPSHAVLALIEKLTDSTLYKLVQQRHVVSALVYYQRGEVVLTALKRIPIADLRACFGRDYHSPALLDAVAALQTSDVLSYFLKIMSGTDYLGVALFRRSDKKSHLFKQTVTQHSEGVVLGIMQGMDASRLHAILTQQMDGKTTFYYLVVLQDIASLNAVVTKLGFKLFAGLMKLAVTDLDDHAKRVFFKAFSKRLCHSECHPLLFDGAQHYSASVCPYLEEQVITIGVVTIQPQVRFMLAEYLSSLKDHTPAQRRYLKGESSPADSHHQSASFKHLCEVVIDAGYGLAKMIKVTDWDDFLFQLKHPEFRPELREGRVGGYKYVHGKDEFVTTREGKRRKLPRDKTKKSSCTWFSPKLNVWPFGFHHDDDRDLVGLLFDRRLCEVKAMFKSDVGTVAHQWRGTQKDVRLYARSIRARLFTISEEDRFRKVIEEEFHLTNELLAKYRKEALTAVVIAKATPTALALARLYRDGIKRELGLELPIVRYDPVYKSVWLLEDCDGTVYTDAADDYTPPPHMAVP